MNYVLGMAAVVGVIWLFSLLPSDADPGAEYCKMWQVWHADRTAGVPVNERYGWPDEAGRYYKECEG